MFIIILLIFVFLISIFYCAKIESFNNENNENNNNNNKSPISNSELHYDPEKWNIEDNDIQKYNNCYAYATNDLQPNRSKKPHPGHLSNIDSDEKDYTCPKMEQYIFSDYPKAYKTDFETKCENGYYKNYLTVDPLNDFHLYRQDLNGLWSHKPGSKKVTNLDASKKIIENPELADRKYKKYDYKDSCMFFCFPNNNNNTF